MNMLIIDSPDIQERRYVKSYHIDNIIKRFLKVTWNDSKLYALKINTSLSTLNYINSNCT